MDVISHYNWARDEKVSTGFKDLFTANVVFEVCTDGGNIQVTKVTGPNDVDSYLTSLTNFLKYYSLRLDTLQATQSSVKSTRIRWKGRRRYW